MSVPMAVPSIVTLTMNPAIDVSARVAQVLSERKLRCEEPRREPGGGGINVARAIRKLEGEALAVFPAGGAAGLLLQGLLETEGIPQMPLAIEGWTRENWNLLEESTSRQYRFCMPGPELRERDWRLCLETLSALRPSPAYVVASGSLPPGVPADFYARLALLAREMGARLVLDSSGDALRLAAEKGVYLLKPSLREFHELTGTDACDETRLRVLARALVQKGCCETLVLSLGSGGALWVAAGEEERLLAPSVPLRSSVGAGDTLVAGIVLSLARGRPLREAVRYGVAASAASIMNPGTELCHREDVERLSEGMRSASGASEQAGREVSIAS